ncbi:MAG: hypothetical protein RQ752_08995 [Thermohalobaculum sp.]|nr:hypothetical protein [Thermohalobaculum sp.]
MFDVAKCQYADASYFDADADGRQGATVGRMRELSQVLIDPRLALALGATALGLAGAPIALAATAALILSMLAGPRAESRSARFGAFTAVELGFFLWSCDRTTAFVSGACRCASAAFAVMILAWGAALGAGVAQMPQAAAMAAAVGLVAMGLFRHALAALVRGAEAV